CVSAVLLTLVVAHIPAAFARSVTRVSFPSIDRDDNGSAIAIQAMLLLPDGPTPAGGFPAIIALHGCSGMYSVAKGREDHLADRDDIARDRIALVGWSHGGSTALAAINIRDREVAAFRGSTGAPPFFRAAVAYYPGCGVSLRAGDHWQPGAPARIHIGALDD